MNKELIVITGCDSGIGKACAELLLKNGKSIAISYLKANPFKYEPRCYAYRMDLTKENEIEKFTAEIKKFCETGHSLSCLFNNAGVALGGPVENTPLSVFRKVMEINFFSYVSLIQKLIPLLKESRGMLLINGSLAGRVATPFLSPYSSSKFALEGFTDSLRRELNPFGIKTVLIEPAAVATPIWAKAKEIEKLSVDKVYIESINAFLKNFVESGSRGMPVHKAAEAIVRIMLSRNPKPRYIITGTPVGTFIKTRLPDRILDWLVKKFFRMNYG